MAKDNRSRPLANHQVRQFQIHQVANSTSRVEQQTKDRPASNILPQFNLSQQPPNIRPIQALGSQRLPAKFLDLLRWVCFDSALDEQANRRSAEQLPKPD